MVHLLQTMLKRSGIGWGVLNQCAWVFWLCTLPSFHGCVVDFLWPVQWEISSWNWSDWLPWAFPGFPDVAGENRISFTKNEENTGAVSQEVWADVPLIMSYHCVSIFTRDYCWGLGAIHFVFDWPPHLDYISFFFLYLSIDSMENNPPTGWEN